MNDKRLRVERNATFAGVMRSHNIAFNFNLSTAKYYKVVSPEDLIFSDCIRQMVEVAEGRPSVGIVGSYQLSGDHVKWQGFEYPRTVVPGREMCLQVYLGGRHGFGFETPTSVLYRADLVSKQVATFRHNFLRACSAFRISRTGRIAAALRTRAGRIFSSVVWNLVNRS
jgi:hypothetical protein